ncbi:hypothetical protein OJF2_51890 [Aquisphaera giovannonii]|uniref:Uncharacterized protein n=1 Tax=Aquisphaera giovannonii TaxID=406548 RepID=A0A5B9W921_9BACT|nr:hypothetical protein [Aquisphaera giovannonii]QEH36605.1 hypothetical protein OJF2_51890 [Aquisphaera giovannonii]
MNARPILMSAPMVRASLDGRKTQTRRVVKPAFGRKHPIVNLQEHGIGDYSGEFNDPGSWGYPCAEDGNDMPLAYWLDLCPYGQPGDLLWVREAFARNGIRDGEKVFYRADGESQFMGEMRESNGNVTRYFTDHWERNGEKRKGADWKPSIHMPRWASRLTLELTGVRVERLKGISEADAKAEGCFFTDYGRRCFHQGQGDVDSCPAKPEHHPQRDGWMWAPTRSSDECLGSARAAFGNLWESINGPGSWVANPWVWVLDFRVYQQNVDALVAGRAA